MGPTGGASRAVVDPTTAAMDGADADSAAGVAWDPRGSLPYQLPLPDMRATLHLGTVPRPQSAHLSRNKNIGSGTARAGHTGWATWCGSVVRTRG
jgi:hypothetical protein